jgi:hypothetical protein
LRSRPPLFWRLIMLMVLRLNLQGNLDQWFLAFYILLLIHIVASNIDIFILVPSNMYRREYICWWDYSFHLYKGFWLNGLKDLWNKPVIILCLLPFQMYYKAIIGVKNQDRALVPSSTRAFCQEL